MLWLQVIKYPNIWLEKKKRNIISHKNREAMGLFFQWFNDTIKERNYLLLFALGIGMWVLSTRSTCQM